MEQPAIGKTKRIIIAGTGTATVAIMTITPGYHQHGDYWFPLAAFATGALITGAIVNNNQNRVYREDSHVQWCYDRYRSYRASDNTFQPNYGPRQQCNSPY